MTTALSIMATPITAQPEIANKTPANYPSQGLLVKQFDMYVKGYNGAIVKVFRAGTTELIPCYSDIGLTEQIDNPQVLVSMTDSAGETYGKFAQPVYVPYGYELQINDEDQSGQYMPPISSLSGEDASFSNVSVKDSLVTRTLRERFADTIRAVDYGIISTSRSSNTETITAAIAAAAAQGGGRVLLPAGNIPFSTITIPSNVMLVGEGKDITSLTSESSGKIVTATGSNAGLEALTLDGVKQQNLSIGLYSKAMAGLTLRDVTIKRFDTNIHHQGGTDHRYYNLTVTDAPKGARFIGDDDYTGTGGGSEFSGLVWQGGDISLTTSVGIELSMRDLPVRHNRIVDINISDNIGSDGAVLIFGARHTTFTNPYFDNNEVNIKIEDNTDTRLTDREVVGLYFEGGQLDTGSVKINGLAQDIIFDQMQISDVTFEANVPENQILLRNCVENSTLFTGDSTKISRFSTNAHGSVKGVTTNATAVVAYKTEIKPNEVVLLEVKITAEQQNGSGKAAWNKVVAATCAPVVITYDEKTAVFTVGSYVKGASSNATGIIVAQTTPTGTTGTLSLATLSGTFIDNELVEEVDGTGSARVNGYMAYGTASILDAAVSTLAVGSDTGAPPTGWACGFQCSGAELQVTVTGAASTDIVWNIDTHLSAL